MNKTRYTPVFNRKKKLNTLGKALIQIECYLNGKNKYFSTQIYVEPIYWNNKNRTIKTDYPNAIKLNKQIAETIRNLENFELDKINAGKPFNLGMLTDFFKGESVNSFTEFMEIEIEKMNLTESTKKNHRTTLARLKEFKKVIYFEDITFELLNDFDIFLRKIEITFKDAPSKKLMQNTIWKYFKNMKTYVNLAINKDLMNVQQYPFRKFKVKQQDSNKVFLTPEEIDQMQDLVLTGDNIKLQYIKDLFMYSVYTGLRFSDVLSMQKRELVAIGGNTWLIKKMEKTDESVRIPIYTIFNGKPIEIINKYNRFNSIFCFEQITNQYANRTLKILAGLAGINKKITFHTARHTTATYLLYKGVSLTTVQKVLGHKKIATTQIYGHIMDNTIEKELIAVNF
ncbi:site-specific integrase [Flavobacterium chilense]|uniref:Site-specific recombinase XerD n=1 Tax=Flavobacterium chilense TaxID=946677 RepID=A0A1M7DPC6_9FLAO|nr:site-specific integrase [Flavobacterium chilense]SHL81346.1 Site-specific recombinase XerD [Flavobacterium chilense]